MDWNSLSTEERIKYETFFEGIGLPRDQHMSYYYSEIQKN